MEKIEEETDGEEGRHHPVGDQQQASRQRSLHRRSPIGDTSSRLLTRSQSTCCPEPRLVPLRQSPIRARRSHSLPISPSPYIIEKLTLDRMPCSPKASPDDRTFMHDSFASPMGSPPSTTFATASPPSGQIPFERKRSIDFSQIHSLGVIREQDP